VKSLLNAFVFLALLVISKYSSAGVECITRISSQLTTNNNHCSKHCGNWANDVPPQTVVLNMPDQFKEKGAFFKNPQHACDGGTCGFATFPPIGISSPTQILYTFRHHSKPAIVTISADVCFYNASTPDSPSVDPTPVPKPPVVKPVLPPAPSPSVPVPPQKEFVLQEAGPMDPDDCTRMKSNWMVNAKMYCNPYNVNIVATNLTCATDSSKLGRSVSGVFQCVK
jgi:hypothetical protein